MQWNYVKVLQNENAINEFEEMLSYKLNESYVDCIKQNNGGRPKNRVFYTENGTERVIKTFLSLNKEDRETVWKIFDWNKEILMDKYIPFAIDNFGNIICFYRYDDSIVFVEHETETVEKIATDFEGFMSCLVAG